MTGKQRLEPRDTADYGIAHAGDYGVCDAAETGLTAQNYREAEKLGLLKKFFRKKS